MEVLMKQILIVICAAMVALASLSAQEISIRKADDLRLESFSFKTADNSQIMFWSDLSSGHRDIWCQKINPSAQPLFGEAVPLVSTPGDQELLAVCPASDNNFIILWAEREINEILQLRIQKVTSNGLRLWGEQGVLVTNAASYYPGLHLVTNSIGGAFVVYQSWITQPVMAQSFDGFGNGLWAFGGVPLVTDPGYLRLYNAVADGSGGLIVNVGFYPSSVWESRLLRFSASGAQVGGNPLIPPSSFPDSTYRILAPVNGSYVLYQEPFNGGKILYLNKMDASGNLLLPQALAFDLSGGEYAQLKRLVNTPEAGVAIAWAASEFEGSAQHFVQKLTPALTPVWPQAATVFNGIFNTNEVQLNPTPDGKLWMSWMGFHDDPFLRAQVLDQNGIPLWEADGKLISPSADELISFAYQDKGIYLWNTKESGFKKIQLQALGTNGAFSYPPGGLNLEARLNYNASILDTYTLGDRFLSLWIDQRDRGNLYFQLLNQNSQALLEPNGRAILSTSASTVYLNAAVLTPQGKLAMIYSTAEYSQEPYQYASYLQMIDSGGNLEFPGNGMLLNFTADFGTRMSSVGNSILIGWIEFEFGQSALLKGQKIVDGQLQWGPSGKTLASSSTNDYFSLKAMQGGYYLWELINLSTGYQTCKALLVDSNGDPAPGWNPGGINLVTAHGYQSETYDRTGLIGDDLVAFVTLARPSIYSTRVQRLSPGGERLWGFGGTSIGEGDYRMNIYSAIYGDQLTFLSSNYDDTIVLRRINSQGMQTTPPEGITVVPATSNCYDAKLVRFANGSMLCAYSDNDGSTLR